MHALARTVYCTRCRKEMVHDSCTIEAMVRGYRVYRHIWDATVGEELSCVREVENYCDPFAVAVVKSDGVPVGHIPRKISSLCLMFLRRGGTIDCQINLLDLGAFLKIFLKGD